MDGRGRDHPLDGTRAGFEWTYAPDTPPLTFAAPEGISTQFPERLANPVVTWPAVDASQRSIEYTLTFTVTDAGSNTATDTVTINVLDRDGTPTANAGPDRGWPVSTQTTPTTVTLNGALSTNGGGVADVDLTYAWIQTSDATSTTPLTAQDAGHVALTGEATSAPTFTAPTAATTLHFLLTVEDTQTSTVASPKTSTDRVVITVQPPLPAPVISVTNFNATEGTVTNGALGLRTVNINGSATVAGHNDATLAYRWTQVDSAAPAATAVTGGPTLTNSATANASFTAPDVYQSTPLYFRLTARATKTGFLASEGSAVLTVTITDVEAPTATISTAGATVVDSVAADNTASPPWRP